MKIRNPAVSCLAGSLLLALLAFAPCARAATLVWIGPGAGSNTWSTGNSWTNITANTTGTAPASSDDVKFFNVGATATVSNVNNMVDAGFAGTIGSLQYGSTNNFHTTVISNGLTLSITNTGGLIVGTPGDIGVVRTNNATIIGSGGALLVSNASAVISLDQGSATAGNFSQSILDLTGLGTFTANVSRIGIGTTTTPNPGSANQREAGTLYLAATNNLTVTYAVPLASYRAGSTTNGIELNRNPNNNAGSTTHSSLFLGLTNVINADSIGVGRDKSDASCYGFLGFNPAFIPSGPVAYFYGVSGPGSRMTWWCVGDGNSSSSSSHGGYGIADFTGGTVNAFVNQMVLGRDAAASADVWAGPHKGTLTFTNGTIDVNTLIIGDQELETGTSTTAALGVLNVGGAGALLKANTVLTLGNSTLNTAAGQNTAGNLNVTNGTVYAANITVGTFGTEKNTITLAGGTLVVTNTLATNASGLYILNATNSTIELSVPNANPVGLTQTLNAGGATNNLQINSAAVFTSYPQTIPLIQYTTLNGGNNFGLASVPADAPGAYLTNITTTTPKSLSLVLPYDPRPVIPPSGEPVSYSGNVGDNIPTNFTVTVAATSVTPLSYQWYYVSGGVTNTLSDGPGPSGTSTLSGSTNANLQITNAQTNDSGNYFAIVTNLYGAATSSIAVLTISSGGPPIVSGPNNQTVIQGNNATFSATVAANPAATISWFTNGMLVPGANSSSLTLTNVQYPANDQESVCIVASNSFASVTNCATLTVIVPPVITMQPTNLVVTNTQAASFTVAATGVPSPTYQWYKNNILISSAVNATATNATFAISSASPSDTATYYVQVSNAAGSSNSVNATLTVNSTMLATTLVPANGATGVCYDTPLYITFNSPPSLVTPGVAKIRIYNVTNSTTPVDTLDMSQNVTLQTPYAINVQPRTIAGDGFYNFPVIITGNTAAIYPHLDLLTSNQTYYAIVDDGVFKDTNGAYFAGITATNAWKFTTKPTGPASATNLVVAADGSGDFLTVQGAVDFVPANNTTPTVINLKNGFYTEIVDIKSKHNLDFRGQTRTGTFIGYPNNNNVNQSGAPLRAMLVMNGNDCTFENLTITNTTPHGGSQAEAIDVEGTRCILYNMELDSFQDTFLCHSAGKLVYVQDSLIQGDTDFNWGYGTEFYTNCELRMLTAGGLVTQPRSPLGSNGFSFVNCRVTPGSTNVTSGFLGRSIGTPTTPSESIFSYCLMGDFISGFNSDAGTNFCDYADSNLTATASKVLAFSRHLTNGDPLLTASTNATTWLYGWVPQVAPYILTPPANQSAFVSNNASFTVSATGVPSPSYQWYDPTGSPIASGTNATLNISNVQFTSAGSYSVVVSDSAGAVTNSATLTVPDRAPVANTATFPRQRNVSLKFLISDLLTNASDPDGDTVSLFSTDTTSTNGATISTNATFVFYLPPGVNPNVTDAFNYTVTDGRGSNTTGLVVVTILPNPTNQTQNITGIMGNPGGSVTVSFAAVPNYTYLVQYATNLPTTNWITISTNVAGTNGMWQFIDVTATNDPMRFYRSALP